MISVCDKCKKTKKIVTHRMGVPWCATCNMQEIRDRELRPKLPTWQAERETCMPRVWLQPSCLFDGSCS